MRNAAMRAGAFAALILMSAVCREASAQGTASAAADRRFVTSAPLPGSLPWNRDAAFGVAGDTATTGTLSLALGQVQGEYRVQNLDATVAVRFFYPEENRSEALRLTVAEKNLHGYQGDGVALAAQSLDSSSALLDFKVTGRREPLAMVELTTKDEVTTDTVRSCPSGMVVAKGSQQVYFQFFGQRVVRSRTPNGFRMVAPLKAATVARLSISTAERKPAEVRELPLADLPAPVDPINPDAKP